MEGKAKERGGEGGWTKKGREEVRRWSPYIASNIQECICTLSPPVGQLI
jgi:hypothetical protein